MKLSKPKRRLPVTTAADAFELQIQKLMVTFSQLEIMLMVRKSLRKLRRPLKAMAPDDFMELIRKLMKSYLRTALWSAANKRGPCSRSLRFRTL